MYQGHKEEYATKITNTILQNSNPRFYLDYPVWDVCCGTAAFSRYNHFKSYLLDAGPWGYYWLYRKLHLNNNTIPINYDISSKHDLAYKLASIAKAPVPLDDPKKFIHDFLLLQLYAFNNKPVQILGNRWGYSGIPPINLLNIDRIHKYNKMHSEFKYEEVFVSDINKTEIKTGCIIYMDPDYKGTQGYGRIINRSELTEIQLTVDVDSFVKRHPAHDLYISHHTVLPGDWTKVIDITISTRRKKQTAELLHFKKGKLNG